MCALNILGLHLAVMCALNTLGHHLAVMCALNTLGLHLAVMCALNTLGLHLAVMCFLNTLGLHLSVICFLNTLGSIYLWCVCSEHPRTPSTCDVCFEHSGTPTVVKPSTGWGSNWTCLSFTQWILYMAQSKWPQQRTDMQMLPTSSCGWYSWQCTGVLFFHCLCSCELCSHSGPLETMAITHCVVSWHDTYPNTHFSCVRPHIRSLSINKNTAKTEKEIDGHIIVLLIWIICYTSVRLWI